MNEHSTAPFRPARAAGSPPGFRNASPQFAERLGRAAAETDALLARNARRYPADLPPTHPDRLKPPPALPGEPAAALTDLDAPPAWSELTRPAAADRPDRAAARLIAAGRDHARAVLVAERLGEVILGVSERERLVTRACGYLPASEEELFRELLLAPELAPGALLRSPAALVDAVGAVSRHFRPATGLAWGMLVLAGHRAPEQLLDAAAKLDRLALRVTSAAPVVQALDQAAGQSDALRRAGSNAPAGASLFEARFGVLLATRDRLWELKPERVSTPFLLPQVVDCYLGPEAGAGNSLGLGILDAFVLGRLGFEVSFAAVGDAVLLEVTVEGRAVSWEVVRPSPLSFVTVGHALRLEPAELFALAWGSLAAAHFAQGRADRAVAHYERVLALRPGAVETWNSLGLCWLRQRQPDRAADCARRALELKPECAEAHHCLGNARAMQQDWPRAIDSYKRAVSVRPDYVEAYNNLGFAFQRAGTPEQAVAAYQAALDFRPDYVQAHFNLGNVALELERYDDAVRSYREAVRLQPAFAQAWYNMGQAHYGKRQLDQALNCYRRAVEVNPKHFGAWHNLGIVYRDKGQRDKAVEALERAISLNPNLMR